MIDCKNKEHKNPCTEEDCCPECGLSTCSANHAYHVCVSVSEPTGEEPAEMVMEDVWGKYDDHHNRITPGMIVAKTKDICPIFKDKVPYKSVTVVGPVERETEITYWLEYVHGANCIMKTKELPDGKIAIRSDYQCW